jgi:pyruvate dehydrogenase E1 component beta subunit
VIVGAGIGAAIAGLRPVAELMTINFAFLALDQIVNHAAKLHYMFNGQIRVPMVIRTVGGGGRQLGATHSQTPDVIFAHFPGLKVVAPGTPADAKGLLKSAIRDDDPVFFIEHATLYQVKGDVPDDEDFLVPIGVSDVKREGTDVTVVSYSKMLQVSLEAADKLAGEGISAEVIDLRTLRPLDVKPIIASVKKTNRLVVVEEGWRSFGIGAEISSRVTELAFDSLDAPVRRVAQAEVPLPYNRRLEQMALPQVDDVIVAVKDVMYLR